MLVIGVRAGARILIDVGDGSSFPSAAHLAAYAGLAPATRSSGSSIRGGQPSRRGNKQLKRTFYCDKKIKQGKHHTQALLPRETTGRRALRDAPRRHLLRTETRYVSLTAQGLPRPSPHLLELLNRELIGLQFVLPAVKDSAVRQNSVLLLIPAHRRPIAVITQMQNLLQGRGRHRPRIHPPNLNLTDRPALTIRLEVLPQIFILVMGTEPDRHDAILAPAP